MPKAGGKRKKTRTHSLPTPQGAAIEGEIKDDIPRSIVVKIGKVTPNVQDLVKELRKLMGPSTAMNLRERSYNKFKDYAAVAGKLNISHLLAISQTSSNIILRISRFPNGPTLYFKILKYSLSRHVHALQKRPYESPAAYLTPPLIVLNNFGSSDENHMKLIGVTLQHMFPSINVKTVRLSECRRVVLFHFNKEEDSIEMRHYAVRASPVGVSRSVKRILQTRIPNLSELEDVSQFVEGRGMGAVSDSEAEDETARVVLPDRFVGHGNAATQQSAMKLVELGPRITLQSIKIESDVAGGDILYHKFISKTEAEAAAIKAKVEKNRLLKIKRKAEQDANVARKKLAVDEKLKLKQDRKRLKLEGGERGLESPDDDGDDDGASEESDGSDNGDGDASDNEIEEEEDNDNDLE